MSDLVDTGEHTEPYDRCRCDRPLICGACHYPPEECECPDAYDDLAEEQAAYAGEDVADLDPLTRTLLGLPSGIHCHDGERCLSGHCETDRG